MNGTAIAPVSEQNRIESLDVLRGFALLGILLLNILSFAFYSGVYAAPNLSLDSTADYAVWAGVEIFAEGAMRCLFSMLFGAGVVLFTVGASGKSMGLHYKRNFWLLAIGFFDAYILLWMGDILVTYALAGFLLYFLRNVRVSRLYAIAGALLLLISFSYAMMNAGLSYSRDVAQEVVASGVAPTAEQQEIIDEWEEFRSEQEPTPQDIDDELEARGGGIASAYLWNGAAFNEMLLFVIPLFLLWDALSMMLIGMALYKSGVLQGERSLRFYIVTGIVGFAVGIMFNAYEVHRAWSSGFDLLSTFSFIQATYHWGRLGMAFGWLGLVLALLKLGKLVALKRPLAAVGRMALTNYLMHSLVFMLIFSGVGLGLVGAFSRSEAYLFVLAMWAFQLWFSSWWLAHYKYGPVEWLWRGLTYGRFPANKRVDFGIISG